MLPMSAYCFIFVAVLVLQVASVVCAFRTYKRESAKLRSRWRPGRPIEVQLRTDIHTQLDDGVLHNTWSLALRQAMPVGPLVGIILTVISIISVDSAALVSAEQLPASDLGGIQRGLSGVVLGACIALSNTACCVVATWSLNRIRSLHLQELFALPTRSPVSLDEARKACADSLEESRNQMHIVAVEFVRALRLTSKVIREEAVAAGSDLKEIGVNSRTAADGCARASEAISSAAPHLANSIEGLNAAVKGIDDGLAHLLADHVRSVESVEQSVARFNTALDVTGQRLTEKAARMDPLLTSLTDSASKLERSVTAGNGRRVNRIGGWFNRVFWGRHR